MPATIIDDPVTCDECRDRVTESLRVDDRVVCADCAQDYPTCDECDRAVTSTVETVDGASVCAQCRDRYYIDCDRCERPASTRTHATDGYRICERCERNYYWQCAGCDDVIPDGDYCEYCDSDNDTSDYLHHYDYKPAPEFHGAGPLYLGFELEISTPSQMLDDCAEVAVNRLRGLGYLKEDSSIVGRGFELVTHPMSYDWALEHFPWSLLTELDNAHCTGSGNGLHVHVSRAAFVSPAHIYRWMKLFYRNERNVTALARRSCPEWADFARSARRHVKDYAKGARGTRYTAINTCPDDTFELRIFASSLDRQEVQAALALTAASVDYTRTLTVSDITSRDGWGWPTFARWVSNQTQYAPLTGEMERLSCAC